MHLLRIADADHLKTVFPLRAQEVVELACAEQPQLVHHDHGFRIEMDPALVDGCQEALHGARVLRGDPGLGEIVRLTPRQSDAVHLTVIRLPSRDKRFQQCGLARPGDADRHGEAPAGAKLLHDRALRFTVLRRKIQVGKTANRGRDLLRG